MQTAMMLVNKHHRVLKRDRFRVHDQSGFDATIRTIEERESVRAFQSGHLRNDPSSTITQFVIRR